MKDEQLGIDSGRLPDETMSGGVCDWTVRAFAPGFVRGTVIMPMGGIRSIAWRRRQ